MNGRRRYNPLDVSERIERGGTGKPNSFQVEPANETVSSRLGDASSNDQPT